MRLGELLGGLEEEQVSRLGREIVPGWDDVPSHMLMRSVESVLRESGQVEQTIQARRPPVMALLRELLEAPGFRALRAEVEARALAVGDEWIGKVGAGELVGRDDSCGIYRRLLMAAWRNDLALDASETSLLGLLRHELKMTAAEHFLIAYHPDIQPFWRNSDPFQVVVTALLAHGVVFEVDDNLILPEEFASRVRRTLGIYMGRGAARRLFDHLSNANLKNALDLHRLKISGSKSDRSERLIENLTPVPGVLSVVHINDLRAVARKTDAQIAGAKEELIWRLIEHFEKGNDLEAQAEKEPEPLQIEPKNTDEPRFRSLFHPLKGRSLFFICERHGLKTSGAKDERIQTLWDSHLSEKSLLGSLKNPELRWLCEKHGLLNRGSKTEMIDRLVAHHRSEEQSMAENSSIETGASTELG